MNYIDPPMLDALSSLVSGAPVEREGAAFRLAMRELASGVALVTAGRGEQRTGCTVTSLCSLSLDPPTLIVCLARTSTTLAALRADRAFGVNILAADHEHLADRFAGRADPNDC